jgi:ketosteroid isomerase-like protein
VKRNQWIVSIGTRILLALHEAADGNWRIARELWNQGTKP